MSPELLRKLQEVMRTPVGTLSMTYHSTALLDPSHPGGEILQVQAGQHLFLLDRDSDLRLHFYHSSPGTGTRVATIDLKGVPPEPDVGVMLSWSPEETQLLIGPLTDMQNSVSAKGVPSERVFRVGKDGSVVQIGDHGVQVEGVCLYVNDEPIIAPTSLNAWNETIRALEYLATGRSDIGHVFEVVVANLTLSILVTGFEAYTGRRFVEIFHEGIPVDENALKRAFPQRDRRERSKTLAPDLPIVDYLYTSRRIAFQNYDNCKRAYKKAYGIAFGKLPLPPGILADLKRYIRLRHQVVHESPLLDCLNPVRGMNEKLVFSGPAMAAHAITCFSTFIETLHSATLSLRPAKGTEFK